jgi:hypothetical protein
MNYPFPIYPGSLASGYTSFNKYKEEVIRLYEHLNYLKEKISESENNNIANLVLMNIGSSGEELIYFFEKNNEITEHDKESYQWRQIHPLIIDKFIRNFKNKKKINIYVTVITPDNYLCDDDYYLCFARRQIVIDDDIEITYTKNNNKNYSYINQEFNLNITINFFNCFVPNIESNTALIKRSNNLLENIKHNHYEINTFLCSSEDIDFVNDFYYRFNEVIKLNDYVNNFVIVHNFATFRNLCLDSKKMFDRLFKLCIENKIMFCEWTNNKGNIHTRNIINIIINGINFYSKSIKYGESYEMLSFDTKDDDIDFIDILLNNT